MPTRVDEQCAKRMVWKHIIEEKTFRQIAKELFWDRRTVSRTIKRFLEGGPLVLSGKKGRRVSARLLGETEVPFLWRIVTENPTMALREMTRALSPLVGWVVSDATVLRALWALDITHKVMTKRAREASDELRTAFDCFIFGQNSNWHPDMYVYIDETAMRAWSDAQVKWAWSQRGVPAPPQAKVFSVRGRMYSACPILTTDGIDAGVYVQSGGMKADDFVAFVETVLSQVVTPYAPGMRSSIVVHDNCPTWLVPRVQAALAATGVYRLQLTLPPYSPDKQPAEIVHALAKRWLRTNRDWVDAQADAGVSAIHIIATALYESCPPHIANAIICCRSYPYAH